jgi:hypothetical protein
MDNTSPLLAELRKLRNLALASRPLLVKLRKLRAEGDAPGGQQENQEDAESLPTFETRAAELKWVAERKQVKSSPFHSIVDTLSGARQKRQDILDQIRKQTQKRQGRKEEQGEEEDSEEEKGEEEKGEEEQHEEEQGEEEKGEEEKGDEEKGEEEQHEEEQGEEEQDKEEQDKEKQDKEKQDKEQGDVVVIGRMPSNQIQANCEAMLDLLIPGNPAVVINVHDTVTASIAAEHPKCHILCTDFTTMWTSAVENSRGKRLHKRDFLVYTYLPFIWSVSHIAKRNGKLLTVDMDVFEVNDLLEILPELLNAGVMGIDLRDADIVGKGYRNRLGPVIMEQKDIAERIEAVREAA